MVKPKIIISNYDDVRNPYYRGGGAVAIHEIARRLTSWYEVTVYCGNYPGSRNGLVDGVNYRHLGPVSAGPRLGQLFFQISLPFLVVTSIYDIWLESFTPPFSTSFLPLFTRRPVIGLVHMLCAADMRRKYHLPFHWVENLGLRVYHSFFVTTPVFRDKIAKINPRSRITVIPNGFSPVDLPKSRLSRKYILFLGRIEINQKGLDLLLEAYTLLADKISYPLVIAGSGTIAEQQKLKLLLEKFGLSDRVKLTGHLVGLKKYLLIRESLCLVVPSRYESFSIVALEALACGTPLVSFDIEGLRWIPQNSRLIVPSFSALELADAINKLVSDAGLRRRMVDSGLNFTKSFTWNLLALKYRRYLNTYFLSHA